MRTWTKNSLVITHWEERAFVNTQEEAGQKSPGKVVSNSSQDRDETPKGHANRKVYGGFFNMIEEHIPVPRGAEVSRRSARSEIKGVRRNLHGDISDVENT
jgi:hypothetical protein